MKGKTLLCLALVASMLFGVFMIGPVAAQSQTIGVEPQGVVNHNLGIGSSFTVEIWARNVADLAGLDFWLGYDTTVLTATSITNGGIFGGNYFLLASDINDAEGKLNYAFNEDPNDPGYDGDGKLAIIDFTVDSLGESALDLYETEFSDTMLPPTITHPPELDGYFSNVHMWLHAEAGLINLASPVGTDWHALLPGYCNRYQLTAWTSDSDSSGDLSICDNIKLKNITTLVEAEYGVDEVTVTINATYTEGRIDVNSPSSTSGGWTTGDGAYSDGGTSASIRSSKPSASQYYGAYGFDIPTDATINSVEVRLDAWGGEYIHLKVSEDGGGTWLASEWSVLTTGSETTYWVDVSGWTSWTPAKINLDKIRAQVWTYTSGGAGDMFLDWIPINVTYTVILPLYVEFDGHIQDFNMANPLYTQWHEIIPVFSNKHNLTSWTDNGASGLSAGDDIQLTNKVTEAVKSYQVDEVSTDIIVTKIAHGTPEFPLGSVLPIALIVAVIYVWWINKRKRVTKPQ